MTTYYLLYIYDMYIYIYHINAHPHPHLHRSPFPAPRPTEGHQALRGSTLRAAQACGQPGSTAAGAAFLRALDVLGVRHAYCIYIIIYNIISYSIIYYTIFELNLL